MKEVLFDTNLVIDFEKGGDRSESISSLIKTENSGKIKIHIPVIVASEKTIQGQKITNFYIFKQQM